MVNFALPNTVPDKFKQRQFYRHNPTVTLMKTTPDENRQLGEELGRKAVAAIRPTSILIPLRGVSAIDQTGKPFDDPAARQSLYDGIRSTRGATELIELDHHINAPEFAEAAANKLPALLRGE